MGMRQSVYEKSSSQDYYKLSSEEYALIKNLWTGVENNPQFHGNSYFTSFCQVYPQYTKYYTLDPRLPLNFDARTTTKFTMIMEAMGYLLLDFYNKPKQLDRLVGFIAMVHKDMRLEKQDMFNFGSCLVDYLSQTFPAQMTSQCHEALTKYLNSIINEISRKMDIFRNYEADYPSIAAQSITLPCGRCTLFTNNFIFGQTKSYWDEWKKQWDERLDEWTAQHLNLSEPATGSSTDEEDSSTYKFKTDDEASESMDLYYGKPSLLTRNESLLSASRIALLSLSKKFDTKSETGPSTSGRPSVIQSDKNTPTMDQKQKAKDSQSGSAHPSFGESMSPRERHRALSMVRDVSKPQTDATVLRRRVRTSRIIIGPTASQVLMEKDGVTTDSHQPQIEIRKLSNTARERRREIRQFSFDLK